MEKSKWLAGLAVLGACALCCALPLLGGAAALGVSSFFVNPLVLAGLALVLFLAGFFMVKRRKAEGTACLKTGCNCGSCAR
ncbi:hypothetical protein [Cohnella candidum]|uniref:Uncharacterized protein n=1 Tax=Cohnella candidum TaxID=2674991 RepID=A0A3G3K1E8_9BACL|nr:hypothetical protein [Cohnella candidum]AYQ74385.1 hypothetical protein EAV92_18505 [Cohnella candidum]